MIFVQQPKLSILYFGKKTERKSESESEREGTINREKRRDSAKQWMMLTYLNAHSQSEKEK